MPRRTRVTLADEPRSTPPTPLCGEREQVPYGGGNYDSYYTYPGNFIPYTALPNTAFR